MSRRNRGDASGNDIPDCPAPAECECTWTWNNDQKKWIKGDDYPTCPKH